MDSPSFAFSVVRDVARDVKENLEKRVAAQTRPFVHFSTFDPWISLLHFSSRSMD